MNRTNLSGRLTRDPLVKHGAGANGIDVAKYTLAVRRPFAKDGQPTADFIRCTVFGKGRVKVAEQYLKKGMKIEVSGELRTSAYTNSEGQRVFATELIVRDQEFAETKGASVA